MASVTFKRNDEVLQSINVASEGRKLSEVLLQVKEEAMGFIVGYLAKSNIAITEKDELDETISEDEDALLEEEGGKKKKKRRK